MRKALAQQVRGSVRPRHRRRGRTSTCRSCNRDEGGWATIWLVLLGLALFAMAGLVIDGGYALAAKREARNQAEQAARIGADALDEGDLRSGVTSVDAVRARQAALSYLSAAGATGQVTVAGDEVTVRVSLRKDTTILAAVGVTSLPVEATATAASITEEDTG